MILVGFTVGPALVVTIHGLASPVGFCLTLLLLPTFFALLFLSRSRVTYYLSSVTLGLMSLLCAYFALTFHGQIPPIPPDPTLNRIGVTTWAFIVCLIFWRFTFSRPSRRFYGFSCAIEGDSAQWM